MADQLLYREYSPNAPWVRMLFWGSLTMGTLAVLRDPTLGLPGRAAGTAGLVVAGLGVEHFLLGLTVEVWRSGLRFGLGNGRLIRSSLEYAEIESLESVTYRPIVEFGGWGVRGFGRRRAWTASGNQAVRLRLTDEREVYLGSEAPRRLEERIRTAMGIGTRGAG